MKYRIFLSAMLLSAHAHAYFDFGAKYSSYPDEDNVQRLALKIGDSGSLNMTGVDYKGKFRLEDINGSIDSEFTITSSKIQKKGLSSFLSECERNRRLQLFDLARDEANDFVLEGVLSPINKMTMANLLDGREDETVYSKISYTMALDESVLGSYSKSTDVKAKTLKNIFEKSISQQKQQIEETGKLKVDLRGQDAFVCDLLTHEATLRFGVSVDFPRPLPVRDSAISSQDLAQVIQKMEDRQISFKTARDGIAMNAILQNDAFKEVLNKDAISFDSTKFLKIAADLVSNETGKLSVRSSDRTTIKRIAKTFDRIEYRDSNSIFAVRPIVQVGR